MSKKRASRNTKKVLKSLQQKRKNYRRGGAYSNFEEELVGMGSIPGGKFTNVKATLPKPENSVKGKEQTQPAVTPTSNAPKRGDFGRGKGGMDAYKKALKKYNTSVSTEGIKEIEDLTGLSIPARPEVTGGGMSSQVQRKKQKEWDKTYGSEGSFWNEPLETSSTNVTATSEPTVTSERDEPAVTTETTTAVDNPQQATSGEGRGQDASTWDGVSKPTRDMFGPGRAGQLEYLQALKTWESKNKDDSIDAGGETVADKKDRIAATKERTEDIATGSTPDDMIKDAEVVGFIYLGSSQINANPKDTKDHPGGVWNLPPTLSKNQLSKNNIENTILPTFTKKIFKRVESLY